MVREGKGVKEREGNERWEGESRRWERGEDLCVFEPLFVLCFSNRVYMNEMFVCVTFPPFLVTFRPLEPFAFTGLTSTRHSLYNYLFINELTFI